MTSSEEKSSTGTKTPVPPSKRKELAEKLPEPSPLSGPMVEVVKARDREAVAKENGIEFRASDHSVRTMITLKANSELPDCYRVDVVDTYQNQVIAYVHIDDLVPLSMEDEVRKIQRPPDSQTHGGGNKT